MHKKAAFPAEIFRLRPQALRGSAVLFQDLFLNFPEIYIKLLFYCHFCPADPALFYQNLSPNKCTSHFLGLKTSCPLNSEISVK